MSKFITFVLFIGLLLGFGSVSVTAQDVPPSQLLYAWTTPTTTGQLGHYLILVQNSQPATGNYSIDWSLSGTAPSACTFRVEGSFDNVNWFGLDTTSPASTSCTTSNMESIAYKPVYYLRINVATWTTGDATTKVIFHFTGGSN
jgi:hypothetical protein